MPYERQLNRFDFLILYTSSNKTSLRFWKLCVTVDIEGVLTSTHSKQNCFYWQPSILIESKVTAIKSEVMSPMFIKQFVKL